MEVNPSAAVLVCRCAGSAGRGGGSEITVGTRRVRVDEPAALGGGGEAPNPVEYYLSALLSCQIVTYRFWAQRLGIEVSSLRASAEATSTHGFFGLDPTVRPGFQEIRVTVDIEGPATEEQYRELQRIVDEHCPVLDRPPSRRRSGPPQRRLTSRLAQSRTAFVMRRCSAVPDENRGARLGIQARWPRTANMVTQNR